MKPPCSTGSPFVTVTLGLLSLVLLAACGGTRVSGRTLLGDPLPAARFESETFVRLSGELDSARESYEADPESEDTIIWYGRRLAYMGRYGDAIDVYTQGLEIHPESFRLLRHRGHRYISVRQLDRAIDDLESASELAHGSEPRIEQDGIPNSRNTPISTTQGNIWYHFGLARYLRGDFEGALEAYNQRFNTTDNNDDNHCSTAYWRYLILMRLGRAEDAQQAIADITDSMDIIENFGYRDLCLLYKGEMTIEQVLESDNETALEVSVENATLAYGISMHHYHNGDEARAREMWEAIVGNESGGYAFGYIAAEAELARGSTNP